MAITIQAPAQYVDEAGVPLSDGQITYYEADASGNLTTLKSIYSDPALTVEISNPQTLNALGATDTPVYTSYPYGTVIEDKNGATVYTTGWIDADASNALGAFTFVDNMNELRIALESAVDEQAFYLKGYYTPGDQGGGFFVYDSTATASDNNGTVIASTSAPAQGRAIRQVDDYLTPQMFGGSNTDFSVDNSPVFINLANEASNGTVRRDIYIPTGQYHIGSTTTLSGNFKIHLGSRVQIFTNNSPGSAYVVTMVVDGIDGGEPEAIVDYTKVRLQIAVQNDSTIYLEWFGSNTANTPSIVAEWAYDHTTFNNDGAIKVSTNWDMTGACDLTNNKTKFVGDGSFTGVVGNNSVINVGKISSETGNKILLGEISDWTFEDSVFKSSWFDFGDATAAPQNILDSIGRYNTKRAIIEVDEDFSTPVSMPTTRQDTIVWRFIGGIIDTTVPSYFSNIEPTTQQIFKYDSAQFPILNQDVDLRWFGAVPDTFIDTEHANNHLAIKAAIECGWRNVQNLPGNGVTGGGCRYRFSQSIEITDVTASGNTRPIEVRDASFEIGSDFVDTTGITGGNYNNGFENTFSWNLQIPVNFKHCAFNGGDDDDTKRYKSTIITQTYNDDVTASFNNCEFVSTNILVSAPKGFKFWHNRINGGSLWFGNVINDYTWTVSNIDVKHNEFIGYEGAWRDGINHSAYEQVGNTFVEIFDNVFNEYANKETTILGGKYIFTFNSANNGTQALPVNDDSVIFPYLPPSEVGTFLPGSSIMQVGKVHLGGSDGIKNVYANFFTYDLVLGVSTIITCYYEDTNDNSNETVVWQLHTNRLTDDYN